MRICDDIVRKHKTELKAENFDEAPDEWMTSRICPISRISIFEIPYQK